jgi:hypothetical protein
MALTGSAASLVTCSTGLVPRALFVPPRPRPPISRAHQPHQWIHQLTEEVGHHLQDSENAALALDLDLTNLALDRSTASLPPVAMASPASPRLLPQLLQYRSSAEGTGGDGWVIHDFSLPSPKLMGVVARPPVPPRLLQNRLAAAKPPGPPKEGNGGNGGAHH